MRSSQKLEHVCAAKFRPVPRRQGQSPAVFLWVRCVDCRASLGGFCAEAEIGARTRWFVSACGADLVHVRTGRKKRVSRVASLQLLNHLW